MSSSNKSSSTSTEKYSQTTTSTQKTTGQMAGQTRLAEGQVVAQVTGDLDKKIHLGKSEVVVVQKETVDVAALQRLEQKIAVEKGHLIDSEKLLIQQQQLQKEALTMRDTKLRNAAELEKTVGGYSAERDRFLAEERRIEQQRADAHAKAVQFENERAKQLAQVVLAQKEAEVSEKLHYHHIETAKQVQAQLDAHRMALQTLESQRNEMRKKEVDVRVKSETVQKPGPVDIRVEVKPNQLPEARISAAVASKEIGLQGRIHEEVPVQAKTFVAAREVKETEHTVEQTQERVVFTSKSK